LPVLRMQNEGDEAVHLGEIALDIAANAHRPSCCIWWPVGKLARTETRAVFAGEESHFDVAGITMVADRQH
jgi:hypothetical protein